MHLRAGALRPKNVPQFKVSPAVASISELVADWVSAMAGFTAVLDPLSANGPVDEECATVRDREDCSPVLKVVESDSASPVLLVCKRIAYSCFAAECAPL